MKHVLMKRPFMFSVLAAMLLLCLSATGFSAPQKKHSDASHQRFDDIGFWVKMFENPERDAWQKPQEVIKALKLKNGDIVADIGAGTGYFTRHLAVAVAPDGKAIGLDISESMVKYMKEDAAKLQLNNYEARVVKTDDPGLSPASVDVVFLCNTYHHIANRVDYFKRLSPALKSDGRIAIIDFYVGSPVGPQEPGHKVAKETVLKEMKEAGYRLLKSHDLLPHQYFLEFGL